MAKIKGQLSLMEPETTKMSVPEELLRLNEITSFRQFLDVLYEIGGKEYRSGCVLINGENFYMDEFSNAIPKDLWKCDLNVSSGLYWGYDIFSIKTIHHYSGNEERLEEPILYIDKNGNAWLNRLNIFAQTTFKDWTRYLTGFRVSKFALHDWKLCKKPLFNEYCINSYEQLESLLKKVNPYAYEFCNERFATCGTDTPLKLLCYPWLEQLCKAGYDFAEDLLVTSHDEEEWKYFYRLTQSGNNLKTIFKADKPVYETLKNERDLKIWDTYRKMYKTKKLTQNSIRDAYNAGYSVKEMEKINSILNLKDENGKSYLNFDTLQRYLTRIDRFEAIDFKEGIQLLVDYFYMCRQLHIRPILDGDSLKREHDVTARTFRERQNNISREKMKTACENNRKFDYTEKVFFGRAIRDYDDLIDEAKQQRNCVASYANWIASGQTLIFVVRETAYPDRSLATVEIDPKTFEVKQKYLACNRPIRNKSLTDFIERFRKEVAKRAKEKTEQNCCA